MKSRIRDTTEVSIVGSSGLPPQPSSTRNDSTGNHYAHVQQKNQDTWCAMTGDEQRRSDQQRADRNREDQKREDRKREDRRLEELRLGRERHDREDADRRMTTQALEHARVRRHATASRARVDAVLNNPDSFIGRQVLPASSRQSRVRDSVQQPKRPVSYPSAPIELHAGQEHHHPDVTGILVEVVPLIGGGMQAGIDWGPGFGRALVTAGELPRRGWQQHRRGDVRFPIELRRTSSGMSLRWLAPTSTQPAADQQDLAAVLIALAATATAAGWRTWRNRNRGTLPTQGLEVRNNDAS